METDKIISLVLRGCCDATRWLAGWLSLSLADGDIDSISNEALDMQSTGEERPWSSSIRCRRREGKLVWRWIATIRITRYSNRPSSSKHRRHRLQPFSSIPRTRISASRRPSYSNIHLTPPILSSWPTNSNSQVTGTVASAHDASS